MQRLLIAMIVVSVVLASCAGQPGVSDRTRVISVGYHSETCGECEILQGKMRRMNWRFALAPVLFIKYDKTSPETTAASESRLDEAGMLQVALDNDGLRKVVLFDAETYEVIDVIQASDPVAIIRQKIQDAMDR